LTATKVECQELFAFQQCNWACATATQSCRPVASTRSKSNQS